MPFCVAQIIIHRVCFQGLHPKVARCVSYLYHIKHLLCVIGG